MDRHNFIEDLFEPMLETAIIFICTSIAYSIQEYHHSVYKLSQFESKTTASINTSGLEQLNSTLS